MNIRAKIQRLKEGLASEANPDLIQTTKSIIQGMTYFYLGVNTNLAKLRLDKFCKDCKHNVPEPVDDMVEVDNAIPALTARMCDHCGGCVLAYKLRQNITKCEFWDE